MLNKQNSILIIRDVYDTTEILQRNLESHYSIMIAADIKEVFAKIKLQEIDLLLKQYCPQDLVQLECIYNKGIKILWIVDYAILDDVAILTKDYLLKPFTEYELLSAVKKILK